MYYKCSFIDNFTVLKDQSIKYNLINKIAYKNNIRSLFIIVETYTFQLYHKRFFTNWKDVVINYLQKKKLFFKFMQMLNFKIDNQSFCTQKSKVQLACNSYCCESSFSKLCFYLEFIVNLYCCVYDNNLFLIVSLFDFKNFIINFKA